jgi:hypothetical protein
MTAMVLDAAVVAREPPRTSAAGPRTLVIFVPSPRGGAVSLVAHF